MSEVDLVPVALLSVLELLHGQVVNECLLDQVRREPREERGVATRSALLRLVHVNLLRGRLLAGPSVLRVLVELVDG